MLASINFRRRAVYLVEYREELVLQSLKSQHNIPQTMQSVRDKCCANRSAYHTTAISRPFFQDHAGEPVPDENFWTSWCKGRLTEADILTIRLGATPSGLTSAHLHHPPYFFTGQMPFLSPNQQRQSSEGN